MKTQTEQTEKTEKTEIVDEEVGRFHVTLDGSVNVQGTRPIGPAIVSVRIGQSREADGGKVFRANAFFLLDGRTQWSTPAQFLDGDVAGFLGRHHRNVVPIELDFAHVETLRVNDFEGPLSFGGPRPTQLPAPEIAAEAARLAELREQTDREIAELIAEIESREILFDGDEDPLFCSHPVEERRTRRFERAFAGPGAEIVCSGCGDTMKLLRFVKRSGLVLGDVLVDLDAPVAPFWVLDRISDSSTPGANSLHLFRDTDEGFVERKVLDAPECLVVAVFDELHEIELRRTKERNERIARTMADRLTQNGPVVGPRAFDLNFAGLFQDWLSAGGNDFELGSGAFELLLLRELLSLGWTDQIVPLDEIVDFDHFYVFGETRKARSYLRRKADGRVFLRVLDPIKCVIPRQTARFDAQVRVEPFEIELLPQTIDGLSAKPEAAYYYLGADVSGTLTFGGFDDEKIGDEMIPWIRLYGYEIRNAFDRTAVSA